MSRIQTTGLSYSASVCSYSRYFNQTKTSNYEMTKQSLQKTETLENAKIETGVEKNAQSIETTLPCQSLQEHVDSNNTPTQITNEYCSSDEARQISISQQTESNDADSSLCGSLQPILSSLSHPQNLESRIKTSDKRNTSSAANRSKETNEKQLLRSICEKHCSFTRRRCSPIYVVFMLFGLLLIIFAALTPVFISLSSKSNTITTMIMTSDDISVSGGTTEMINTTTLLPIALYCGQSCLYQSWITSSDSLASWPFDGSYDDVMGNRNPIPYPYLPSFVTGYVGQAASFNASAMQGIYTSFIPLNNVSFTVTAWIRPTGYPNLIDHSIVGLCPSATSNRCLHMSIRYQKLYFGFYFDDTGGTTTILLDQWVHTAFVFDVSAKKKTIYLNGIQDSGTSLSGIFAATSGNFTIGVNERVLTMTNNFQGYIDQLTVNQRAMSSCEILERATLTAYFKFNTLSPYNDSGPNGVITTSSNTSIVTGYLSQAISLTGSSSSYFQASGFTSLGISNQSFSITFWIKPQTLSGTLIHLSSSSLGTGLTCFPLLGFASNGTIVAQVLASSGTVITATGPILPVSSSWIFVVQTWSATNGLKLYVNNTLVSSVTASKFLGSGTTPNYLTLGGCLSGCGACSSGAIGAAGPFAGISDDWRIYSREVSSADVCTLCLSYNNALIGI